MSLVSHSGSGLLAMTLNKFELMSSSIKGEKNDSVECNKALLHYIVNIHFKKYVRIKYVNTSLACSLDCWLFNSY